LRALLGLAAPAKLNLFLHVVGQRPDGYHLIESVFVLIDWCDTIDLHLRQDGHIQRQLLSNTTGLDLPAGQPDLCTRAAELLKAHTQRADLGVTIGLHKHIPIQAGLGGGSSDAATVLMGLNRLWGLGLDAQTLQTLGLQLGADVPFFLGGRNAWVQGIGEDLTPLAAGTLASSPLLWVLKPEIGVSTPDIFKSPHLKRDTKHAILAGFAAQPFGFGNNDLQAVACGLNPQIGEALRVLGSYSSAGGQQARMSGSGSACFAPVEMDEAQWAKALADSQIQLPGSTSRLCQILAQHPLSGW
jgi:4-diphosphocytidyl-2-C-methyl-D-erythritol kinase